MSYTTAEVEKLLGLKASQVRAFVRAGFLAPQRGVRSELLFSFQDVVLLRTARGLLDARVPASEVKRALSRLRTRLPEGAPLAGIHIRADGRHIIVREGESLWQIESGQAVFDFDVDDLAKGVASLERVRAGREKSDRTARDGGKPGTADAEALYQRGSAIEDRDPAAARTAYEQALALDARHLAARINLGRLLQEAGDLDGAERHYRQATAIDPQDATSAFNLAVALEDVGKTGEAIEWYRRAIAIDPDDADARYNLSRLLDTAT